MSTDFDKFAILESFLDEVTSYLPEIEANLDRLQQQPGDREAIEETYRRAHTIGGSAAMMEFTALARVAQGMEGILGEALDGAAPLDAPAIGLLRRSFGRLGRLLEQVRSGGDGAQILAEDDGDRAASRGTSGVRAGGSFPGSAPDTFPSVPAAAVSAEPAPRLPKWLQAFGRRGDTSHHESAGVAPPRTPDPWDTSLPSQPTGAIGAVADRRSTAPRLDAVNPPPGAPVADASLDDMLQAFRGQGAAPSASDAGAAPVDHVFAEQALSASQGAGSDRPTAPELAAYRPASAPRPPAGGAGLPTPSESAATREADNAARSLLAISPAWEELQVDETSVQRQVARLRDVTAALREAAQAIEDERTELRTFLDGSKDAIDRLEEWAGQAMGLDLRQSPEHVRRYLPLSVIWVTSTRLKRLIALLNNSTRQLTASQEDITESLRELHDAIVHVGGLFTSVAAVAGAGGINASEGGYSATVAQVAHFTWAPPGMATDQAPVVESSARNETPADLADDDHTSAEKLPPGARAELERSVREELRRELEDDVRAEMAAEVRREEVSRLRQELEIQVRRQVLSELTPGLGASGSVAAVRLDGAVLPAMPSAEERAPKPIRVSEQSPEAFGVFQEEADEHLQHIAMGLRQLQSDPTDVPALQSVRRATHTLKGAAGMMGFAAIQQIAHASEDLLDRLVDGSTALTPEALGVLLDTADTLERLSAGGVAPDDEQAIVDSLQRRFNRLLGGGRASDELTSSRTVHHQVTARPAAPAVVASPSGEPSSTGDANLSVRIRLSKLDELIMLFGDLLQNRSILDERVSRLGRMIADTTIVSQRLGELGAQLDIRFEAATLPSGRQANGSLGMAGQQELSGRSSGGLQSRLGGNGGVGAYGSAHLNEFDELELDRYNEFHRLSRGLSESVADMGTLSSEMETLVHEVEAIFARETRLSSVFQDRLMKARLVPLQSLVPRLYRASSASAIKQGKEVEFYVQGGDTEVDRTVYEDIADPLQHLVRNAVVHGVEQPDVRERAGKPRAGGVYLSAAEEGNQVVIVVRDDGAGVDAEALRIAAIARGLIDTRARLTQAECLDLMFKPGMTTTEKVDEESGRGVGLDVVRDAVSRLRGTIEVESTPGQGTAFTLRLPVSLQITRAVLAKVGTQLFAVPMAVVEQIGRLDYYERVRGDGPPAIEVRGNVYPLVHMASYLDVAPGPIDQKSPVLLYSAGKQRFALILDGIPGRQEVVVKGLGPHLREVRGVAGATVLGDGKVVLILNLPELLALPLRPEAMRPELPEAGGSHVRLPTGAPPAGGAGAQLSPEDIARLNTGTLAGATGPSRSAGMSAPIVPSRLPISGRKSGRLSGGPAVGDSYVLVVDDSPSVRRVVGNMLKSHGWDVQSARDGIEALEVVAKRVPAAVLLDIEMPRMDGYELLATLRSQPQYRQLPLIVITSRAAAKHQQRAIQLGADAYIVKPYQDDELLRTLENLVARQA